jgi:HEAT repeat protein
MKQMSTVISSVLLPGSAAAEPSSAELSTVVKELIAHLKDSDENVRTAAWQTAGTAGAGAVKPLAALMSDADLEVARAAKRALWRLVHEVGRPGADRERTQVAANLLSLLSQPSAVRREALAMLSEIGDGAAVSPIVPLLSDTEVRDDARAALERIPGDESLGALKAALNSVPDDFKPAIAHSLRVRGVAVAGYPSQKLVPTRPAGAAAKAG